MDPPTTTPPAPSTVTSAPPPSSTITESCISSQMPPPPSSSGPSQLLELSIISAQDLAAVSKSMQTYAITWIQPNRKKTTRIDPEGHKNPTWNDKFAFRLDKELLSSEDAAVTVEIYAVSWFRDVLVGNVRVLFGDLITPLLRKPQPGGGSGGHKKNTRFVALQVRRPSGNPQGILNMGVALVDSTMRSMPIKPSPQPARSLQGPNDEKGGEALGPDDEQGKTEHDHQEIIDDPKKELHQKIHLWRSMSFASNTEDFPVKPGSVYNGSTVNAGSMCGGGDNSSELCSDIGPSASVVAAELARKLQPPLEPAAKKKQGEGHEETGSSILEELTIEEARAKGYIVANKDRARKASSAPVGGGGDGEGSELSITSMRSRRGSDGLFSCFGNAYGIEFTIVCGASKNSSKKKKQQPPTKANST